MRMSTRYGRRAFLSGGAALIGLPFFEALAPRKAMGQVGSAPKRFLAYFYPNGIWMADWRPIGTGATFQFGPAMGATGRSFASDGLPPYPATEDGPGLDQFKSSVMVISGLQNTHQVSGLGDHAGGIGSLLTNRSVSKAANATMGGPSIDFVLSKAIGQTTKRPYLAMGAMPAPAGGTCDVGFSCAVGDRVSFDDMGVNLPRFDNPGQIFDQLFAGAAAAGDPAAAAALAKLRMQNQSILDLVNAEATSLRPTLSYQDRPRLDEYLTSLREVERRIATMPAAAAGATGCMPPPRQSADFVVADGRQSIDLCHQLMALALQCDATRVISFMWGNTSNGRPHNFIGCSGGHHDTSHHGSNTVSINKLKRIDYWWYRRFADLVGQLKKMPDVDGRTVLDNTLIFQSSDISDGDRHNHDDMPVVLAGGAAGFRMGQHVQVSPGPWFGDLFLAIAKGFGINNLTTFGEHGTAPLAGLT